MRPLTACLVSALIVSGCGSSPRLPTWLGGEPSCRLDGPVVEDDRLQPAVASSPPGGEIRWPLGHFLPEVGTRLRVRVDESGHVSSVCVVGEPDSALATALQRRLNHICDPAYAMPWPCPPGVPPPPFAPARLDGRAVPSVITVTYRSEDDRVALDDWGPSPTSLEALALSRPTRNAPFEPGEAFARLGRLGTRAAYEAIARIERAARAEIASIPTAVFGVEPRDAWPIAHARGIDGTEFLVVRHRLFTSGTVALTWRRTPTVEWNRPVLVPIESADGFGNSSEMKATAIDADRLRLDWEDHERLPDDRFGTAKAKQVKRTAVVSMADVSRDSDGDGWTDLEEQRMSLDPRNPDTDGDGVPDGADRCPNLAASAADDSDETAVIIRKAALAVFGLPGSPRLMIQFAGPDANRVSLVGVAGPIIYGRATRNPDETWSQHAHWVTWQVALRTTTTASVVFEDSVSGTGGQGHEVFLVKRAGTWIVVFAMRTWQS